MTKKTKAIKKRTPIRERLDYGIILSLLILCVFSIITIYSTTVLINGENERATIMHLAWYGIGILLIIGIMHINAKLLWRSAPYLYGCSLILLVLVLFFYDRQTALATGAKSWFNFGIVSFQPSELVKIALILILARVITHHNTTYRQFKSKTIKTDFKLAQLIILWSLPALILVILQNDLGTTLVIVAIIFGMTLLSGISNKIIIPTFLGIFLLFGVALYLVVYNRDILLALGFKQYQFERIDSWLNPFAFGSQGSYQIQNALMGIATGGITGKGIGVTDVHVPVRSSDMIFSTIGENFGLLGSFILILFYLILIYQMVQVCFDTKNEFYTYISVGVISMIFFHVFENIGMNINLLPLTGIPLPFISQGGSSLIVNLIGVGLILSMRYQSDK